MYAEGVSIITPTGDRPICIQRLSYYILRSLTNVKQRIEWLIATDGSENYKTLDNPYIICFHNQYPGDKALSFLQNMTTLLNNVKYDKIIVMEDDDWYYSNYVNETLDRLRNVTISGQTHSIYYNINKRCHRTNGNSKRSSWFETAFRSELIPKVKKYADSNKIKSAFLDARVWKHVVENKIPYLLTEDKRITIGIKGMPGRLGIGIGHRPKYHFRFDAYYDYLKQLIGVDDADWYIKLALSKQK